VPLSFLVDENVPVKLLRAVTRHNATSDLPLDVLRVGDVAGLPLASDDSTILRWAERERRILLTLDEQTMPGHLAEHLQIGHSLPGILLVRSNVKISDQDVDGL
jgi:hypothetical protein